MLVVLSTFLLGVACGNVYESGRFDLPSLFGDRRDAIFDLWSVQHFCTGILIGTVLMRTTLTRLPWRSVLLLVLLLALCWELIELLMEGGFFGAAISRWKDGFEHWSNRLVGDPLMVSSGSLVGRRYANAWKVVSAPAAIWLVLNAASPSSMYVQRVLFAPNAPPVSASRELGTGGP
jgi:hypothetical protein